ncbi:hypothetical protein [Neobacillus niacini]|uniref:hypothetical protein n=1 Tax=Neobacillus niacini TaxID=86668 RepID=UPI0028631A5B|nr:hypothetical protein [Neobacillus niacini]MDR7000930.1 hypothetical protein [Neobacillus niacini]
MVIQRPQMEQSELTHYIPPKGEFETFRDDEHFREKLREWGLSASKEEFWYKERNYQRLVSIKGYEIHGRENDLNTLVIEFQDGNLSCIHPAYLKEMQQGSFGKESMFTVEEKEGERAVSQDTQTENSTLEEILVTESEDKAEPAAEAPIAPEPKKAKEPKKPKKEKAKKLDLPADKVHFTATVKQFAMTYNGFTEENDEVVILENVTIVQESPLVLDFAWCSHSKTLKKFELAAGDKLEFYGKVAHKKLPKGKDVEEEFIVDVAVLYKINNPSKIVKQ